jgi:hypothetical protein
MQLAGLSRRASEHLRCMTELPASQVGDLHVATVVINVVDMERAVRFWTEALGYEPREKDWNSEFMMLMDPLDLHCRSLCSTVTIGRCSPPGSTSTCTPASRTSMSNGWWHLVQSGSGTGHIPRTPTSSSSAIRTATSSASLTMRT